MNRKLTMAVVLTTLTVAMTLPSMSGGDPPKVSADAATTQPIARPPADRVDLKTVVGDINFDRIPFEHAIEFIRDLAKANIVTNWNALADVGVTKSTPIGLRLSKVTFETALRAVLISAKGGNKLTFRESGGVVMVSSRDDLQIPEVFEGAQEAPELNEALGKDLPKLDLADVPLEEAVNFLHDAGKINIVVDWGSLEGLGLLGTTPVNVHLEHIRLGEALRYLLVAAAGRDRVLAMAPRANVVTISTASVITPMNQMMLMGAPPPGPDAEATATELGKKLWAMDIDIAGLKARIAACQRLSTELAAKKGSDAVAEKVTLIRATAEIDLADLLARRPRVEDAFQRMLAEAAHLRSQKK